MTEEMKSTGNLMAPEKRSPETLDLWRNLYRYYNTFADMGNSAEDWERACIAMTRLYNSYKGSTLAKAMILALYDWLSEERKAGTTDSCGRKVAYQTSEQRT